MFVFGSVYERETYYTSSSTYIVTRYTCKRRPTSSKKDLVGRSLTKCYLQSLLHYNKVERFLSRAILPYFWLLDSSNKNNGSSIYINFLHHFINTKIYMVNFLQIRYINIKFEPCFLKRYYDSSALSNIHKPI